MIILDTNVLSALMRAVPDAAIVTWLDGQPSDSIWITCITLFETRYGLSILPSGRRRRTLEEAFTRVVEEDMENRVLDLDMAAAASAASIAALRHKAGRPVELRDTLIAGIATARHATVATRNARHFADLKVPVVDPWSGKN